MFSGLPPGLSHPGDRCIPAEKSSDLEATGRPVTGQLLMSRVCPRSVTFASGHNRSRTVVTATTKTTETLSRHRMRPRTASNVLAEPTWSIGQPVGKTRADGITQTHEAPAQPAAVAGTAVGTYRCVDPSPTAARAGGRAVEHRGPSRVQARRLRAAWTERSDPRSVKSYGLLTTVSTLAGHGRAAHWTLARVLRSNGARGKASLR